MMSNKLPHGSYNAQEALVNTLKQDGINALKRGVCVGASSQAIQLGLQTGSTNKFDEMIHYIYQHSNVTDTNKKNDFLTLIEELKEKRRHQAQKSKMTKNKQLIQQENDDARLEEELFNHYALLNQIQVHNTPSEYSELFGKMVDQHEFNHISSVITKTDDDSTTIKNRRIWLGIYTESQIRHFISFINKANTENLSIAFSIKSVRHQISVFYLNDQWHLTDIASMPSKHYPNTNGGIELLTQHIHQQLKINNSASTALGIGLFSATENINSINKMLSRLNSSDKFTKFDGLIPAADKIKRKKDELLDLAVHAINHKDTVLLKNIILAGVEADDTCWMNSTLFHLAAANGNTDQLRILLKQHEEKYSNSSIINLKTELYDDETYADTPLLIAASGGHYDTVDYLLRHGANPNTENSIGRSPLLEAIASNNINLPKLLVKSGADINLARKSDMFTPLLFAITKNDFAMVKLLIDLKANFRDKNGKWGTPLEFAEKNSTPEIVEYLKLKLAEPEQENVRAAASSRSKDRPESPTSHGHGSHRSALFKSERSKPAESDRHSSRHSSSEHKSHSPKMYASASSRPKHNETTESESQAAAAYRSPSESTGKSQSSDKSNTKPVSARLYSNSTIASASSESSKNDVTSTSTTNKK